MKIHIEYRGAVIWKDDSIGQSHSWNHLEALDRVLLEHYIGQVKFLKSIQWQNWKATLIDFISVLESLPSIEAELLKNISCANLGDIHDALLKLTFILEHIWRRFFVTAIEELKSCWSILKTILKTSLEHLLRNL